MGDGDGDSMAADPPVPVQEVTEEELQEALTTLLHAAATQLGLSELPERFEVIVDFTLNPNLSDAECQFWVDETTYEEDLAQQAEGTRDTNDSQ